MSASQSGVTQAKKLPVNPEQLNLQAFMMLGHETTDSDRDFADSVVMFLRQKGLEQYWRESEIEARRQFPDYWTDLVRGTFQ